MLTIAISMIVILLLAAAVVVYAAYPARGKKTPYAPWVGERMERAAQALPMLEADESKDWSLRR